MEIEQEHPVPQQISSYQFRLVGDMTIKQFSQVAAGALISLFFYATALPPIIKWPLILVSFLTGLAMAFVSLQDRPLQVWVIAFFRSVYTPTEFYWKKTSSQRTFFKPSVATPSVSTPALKPVEPVRSTSQTEQLNAYEQKVLSDIVTNAQQNTSIGVKTTPTTVQVPQAAPVAVEPSNRKVSETSSPKQEDQAFNINVGSMTSSQPSASSQAQFSPDASPPNRPTTANVVVGQVMDSIGKTIDGAILEIRDRSGRPVRALKTNRAGHFFVATPLANGDYQISIEKENYVFDQISFTVKGEVLEPIAIRAKNTLSQNS